jgi:hypothetical protein
MKLYGTLAQGIRMDTGSKYSRLKQFLPLILLTFFVEGSYLEVAAQRESRAPLDVHLVEPLRWEGGCLAGSLDRTNRSSSPLFLTKMGPYFYIALDVSNDDSEKGEAVEWVNLYGETDIRDMGSNSLAPGSTIHNRFCFNPTVWVGNRQKQTRREIPVRGKMRIGVSYFVNDEDWKSFEKYGEEGPLGRPLQWVNITADIPCPNTSCQSDCMKPPVGIHGEGRPVPDIGLFFKAMDARGRELTEELSQKFPTCSAGSSTLHKATP